MQYYKGVVVDEHAFEIEVWVENEPESDTPSHVFLMYGGSQVGDFPFNQPNKHDLVADAANRVAAGDAKRLGVFPDAVIDPYDEATTWH